MATSGIRVYMKNKPDKWGIKIWKLVDQKKKFLYHFDIYTGKKGNNNKVENGLGQKVVLKMAEQLPRGKLFKIYADNFFSSVKLVEILLKEYYWNNKKTVEKITNQLK